MRQNIALTLAFALGLLFCQSCAVARARATPPAAENYIVVTVVSSTDTSLVLPGIEVITVAGDGSLQHLGQTNVAGEIRLSKTQLKAQSVSVVLFCHRIFFCGALMVKESRLLEFDEHMMALSPITVR